MAALWLSACVSVQTQTRPEPAPLDEVQAYLRTWASGDFAALRRAVAEPPADFEARHERFRDELGLVSSRFELGRVDPDAEGAVATFRAVHVLRGLGEWRVEGMGHL